VIFIGINEGTSSGHNGGANRSQETIHSHLGTEVWIKGISFDFMLWLKPLVSFISLNVFFSLMAGATLHVHPLGSLQPCL